MDITVDLEWLAYATRAHPSQVQAMGFTSAQIAWLGRRLSENKLLNPPRGRPIKPITFICACGCGEVITTTYRTKRPKYKNAAHKQRALRKRRTNGYTLKPHAHICCQCQSRRVVSVNSILEPERHYCSECLTQMV